MTTIKKDKIRLTGWEKPLPAPCWALPWQWLSVVSLPGWGLVE